MDKKGFDWKSFGIGVIAGSAMSGPTPVEIERQRLNQITEERIAEEKRQAREQYIKIREQREQEETEIQAEVLSYKRAHQPKPLTLEELETKNLVEEAQRERERHPNGQAYEYRQPRISKPQITKKPYKSLIPRWLDVLGFGVGLIAIFIPLSPTFTTLATILIIGSITLEVVDLIRRKSFAA